MDSTETKTTRIYSGLHFRYAMTDGAKLGFTMTRAGFLR